MQGPDSIYGLVTINVGVGFLPPPVSYGKPLLALDHICYPGGIFPNTDSKCACLHPLLVGGDLPGCGKLGVEI